MIAGSYSSYSKCCSPFRYGCAATTQKCAATDLVGGQKSGGFSWSTQSTLGSSELAPMFEKQTLFLRHLEKIKSLQTTTTPTQTPTTTTRTTTTTTTTKKNMHDWKTISCYKWNRSLIDPCYIIDTFGVSPYVPSNHVTNPLDHPRTGKSWHRLCLGIVLWTVQRWKSMKRIPVLLQGSWNMTPTQTSFTIFCGKSLKITIHLHQVRDG